MVVVFIKGKSLINMDKMKISQKIKYKISLLKGLGKVKGTDYFMNDSNNLVIKKKGFNEIVINNWKCTK